MIGKPRGLAFFEITLHSEPADRDSLDRLDLLKLTHQLQTAVVRQADVAHHEIKALFRSELQRCADGAGTFDVMTAAEEEALQ